MAASPHALGVGTPSITKWMLPSSSANANAGAGCSATTCAAACGPAAPLPRLRLAASSSSTSCCSSAVQAQAPRHQAKLRLQATAVDGEVSVAEEQTAPSSSPFVLEEGLEQQPQQRRRGNAGRRVSVKSEDLKEGALFPGTVRTVTSYGAFVDIGAFTDGLVHISQLSDSFVSQVQDLVAVGQQVSVRILDVDFNAGRISLSMRPVPAPASADAESEGDAAEGDAAAGPRGPPSERRKIAGRGNSANKSTAASSKPSVQKGQSLTGVVKNVIKSGAFVTLPGGDEGFLRASDMSNPGTVLESLVGQELSVRVQRIDGRGKVSLTQKVEVDMKQINLSINNNEQGGAANPFELAFRKNNFVVQEEGKAGEAVSAEDSEDEVASQEEIAVAEALEVKEEEVASFVPEVEETLRPVEGAVVEVPSVAEETSSSAVDTVVESASVPEVEETVAEETTVAVEEKGAQVPALVAEAAEASVSRPEPVREPEAKKDIASAGVGEGAGAAVVVAPALVKELRQISGAGMMDCKKALVACNNNLEQAVEYLRKKGLASADKKASRVAAEGAIGSYIHDGRIGVLIEVNSETDFVARGEKFKELVQDLAMQVAAYPQVQYVSVEDIPEEIAERERRIESTKEDLASKPEAVRSKIVEGRVSKLLKEVALLEQPYIRNDKVLVREHIKETIAALGENLQVRRFHRFNLGEGIEKKVANLAADVAEQTKPKEVKEVKDVPPPAAKAAAEPAESAPEVVVPAAAVKVLRQATGAGMMDCKKALAACGGDVDKATEYLRKKGLASAEKKASRVAAEGVIGKYIHDGRIGVLLEVNCETDFVARGDRFKELVQDLAMQVVACPQVQYVTLEDIPAEYVAREKEVESQKEDLASKPEAVRSKIVDGRVSKRLAELALLEQAYIRNDKVLVKDHVKEAIAALGENIQVRRFVKFVLGEGIQKKTVDFAAEVAAQTKPK